MKKESGKSTISLLIITILVLVGIALIINFAKQMMIETKNQDLRTNMLLMQAETKKGLEEVCFRTVNLDSTKEADLNKINEIKNEYLKGIILENAPEEVKEATKEITEIDLNENCYYLNEDIIKQMGIENIEEKEDGYFIVKYDFSNANVEVINTKGYNGSHTLTQINKDLSNEESISGE